MSNFLFANNFLQQKLSKGPTLTPKRSNKKTSSLITKPLARYIAECFRKGNPFVLKSSGHKITFEDCNSIQDAITKVAKVYSRMASHKKSIIIAGKKYESFTNDSFLNSVHNAFADHYKMHCVINNINGSYQNLNTYNYSF